MPQELVRQEHANGVLPHIVRAGAALPVSIIPGKRIGTASLQNSSKNVFDHRLPAYRALLHQRSSAARSMAWVNTN